MSSLHVYIVLYVLFRSRLRAVSLFFRFNGGSAREHKRRAAEPRDERNQGGASPVWRLQSRAWSFSCLAQHVGISLRECFTRSSLFLSKSIKIIIVCLVYSIFYFSVIPYLNQIRQSIKLMPVSNRETIFLELDHISGWLAFPPVKFKQQTITKQLVKNNSHTSASPPQISFCGETSVGVTKCRLFSQATRGGRKGGPKTAKPYRNTP